MNYEKTALSYTEILQQLKSRGLNFQNESLALQELKSISYFRIASYLKYYESNTNDHRYKEDSFFEDALYHYYFDKELRCLLFEAIQTIEISFRSKIIHHISLKHSAFWFLDQSLCKNLKLQLENLQTIEREIKRSKEDFILEYYNKYDFPHIPPCWKTLEVTSFGTISKLYLNLNDSKIKKLIAREFNLPQHEVLESWIKGIVLIRNYVAHHSRIWNRRFSFSPKLHSLKLQGKWIKELSHNKSKLYNLLCCIIYLLDNIQPNNNFRTKLNKLLTKYNKINLYSMGFPSKWREEDLWNKNL